MKVDTVRGMFLLLETATIRKMNDRPMASQICLQLMSSLNTTQERLDRVSGSLVGEQAAMAFVMAAGDLYTMDMPPFRTLAKRYPQIQQTPTGIQWIDKVTGGEEDKSHARSTVS